MDGGRRQAARRGCRPPRPLAPTDRHTAAGTLATPPEASRKARRAAELRGNETHVEVNRLLDLVELRPRLLALRLDLPLLGLLRGLGGGAVGGRLGLRLRPGGWRDGRRGGFRPSAAASGLPANGLFARGAAVEEGKRHE